MQILINGLVSGSAIALMAVALQARVFFIGLAGIYSATPLITHAEQKAGAPIWLTALAEFVSAVLLIIAARLNAIKEIIQHSTVIQK